MRIFKSKKTVDTSDKTEEKTDLQRLKEELQEKLSYLESCIEKKQEIKKAS